MNQKRKEKVKSVKKKSTKKSKSEKTEKKSRMSYDKETLSLAVQECRDGAKVSEVSRKLQVPESTLRAKLVNKYSDKKPGVSTQLTDREEDDLHTWNFYCGEKGFPVTKQQVLDSVKILCDTEGKETSFADNRPGRAWWERFMKKYKDISVRISENVNANRAKISEAGLRSWFSEIQTYLTKANLLNIDPSRVFNTDETPLALNPKPQKVLAKKGSKDVYHITGNNEKENVTVLVTGNAIGQLPPPLILFKGKSLPKNVIAVGPKDYGFGYSDNGYMTSECFYEFIANVFYPWLVNNKIDFPVVMFLDGHKSHITLPLSKFCREKQIVLIALYPNATHVIQPLDVAFFKALKVVWAKTYDEFCKTSGSIYLEKHQFSIALKRALERLDVMEISKNGFRRCGLHPFNADAVDYTKIFRKTPRSGQESADDQQILVDSEDQQTLKLLEKFIQPETLQTFRRNADSS